MAQRDASGLTERARYWQQLIRDWRSSGRSLKAFCRERQLNYGTLGWWKRQLAGREHVRSTACEPSPANRSELLATTFAPIRIQAEDHDAHESRIEIVLPGQRCLRLRGPIDRQQLTDVLAVLEAAAC